jgi:hypothetical protein
MRCFKQSFGTAFHTAIAARNAALSAIRDSHSLPTSSFTKRANGNIRFHNHL